MGEDAVLFRSEADGGPAVAADAGIDSAETAWLVAHLAEGPGALHAMDTISVRTLSARGGEGIRSVLSVFRAGDSLRVPYARRVFERVAIRACAGADRAALQTLILQLELGRVPDGALNEAGVVVWSRIDSEPWPDSAIARVERWIALGMPCETDPSVDDAGADARSPDATVDAR